MAPKLPLPAAVRTAGRDLALLLSAALFFLTVCLSSAATVKNTAIVLIFLTLSQMGIVRREPAEERQHRRADPPGGQQVHAHQPRGGGKALQHARGLPARVPAPCEGCQFLTVCLSSAATVKNTAIVLIFLTLSAAFLFYGKLRDRLRPPILALVLSGAPDAPAPGWPGIPIRWSGMRRC